MEKDFNRIEDLFLRYAYTATNDITYEEAVQGAVTIVDLYYNSNY